MRPASMKVCGLPAEVTQYGNSFCTGRGSVRSSTGLPSGPSKATVSPRHNLRTTSMLRNITFLLSAKLPGISAKSFGCQPEANEMPTRPLEMLSTTDHSSATRAGWCSGSTTLPARMPTCSVTAATAAPATAGFGYRPPNAWKWRSGVHTAEKPFLSAYFAPSSSRRYLSCPPSFSSAEK
jgi:hypothetical protein